MKDRNGRSHKPTKKGVRPNDTAKPRKPGTGRGRPAKGWHLAGHYDDLKPFFEPDGV